MKRLAAFLGAMLLVSPAFAQQYPYQNPSYTPTPTLDAQTLSAPGTVTFVNNGQGVAVARVTGTFTGLVINFQGSVERNGTVNWTNIAANPSAGGNISTITAAGLYKVNASGYASIRANVTGLSTGSVNIAFAGGPTPASQITSPVRVPTYSASVSGLAPAASATDFFTLTGSATTVVRVTHAECSGISTANATATVQAMVRSTANTAGTSAAAAPVAHDSVDPAATATPLAYTANPTVGTPVGSFLRSGKLTTTTAATSSVAAAPLAWDFGGTMNTNEPVVLRGITQVFALNGAGASFSAGTALNCSVTWTEE